MLPALALLTLAALGLLGAGQGLLIRPLLSGAIGAVPTQHTGLASGIANSALPIGAAAGTAAFGAVFHARIHTAFTESTAIPNQLASRLARSPTNIIGLTRNRQTESHTALAETGLQAVTAALDSVGLTAAGVVTLHSQRTNRR